MSSTTATIIERYPGGTLVRVQAEELNESNAKAIRTEVSAAGEDSPHVPVVLDLANVRFMRSLSLGILIELSQILRLRNQRLVLGKAQPPIRQLLAITRLDRMFEISDNLSEYTGAANAG